MQKQNNKKDTSCQLMFLNEFSTTSSHQILKYTLTWKQIQSNLKDVVNLINRREILAAKINIGGLKSWQGKLLQLPSPPAWAIHNVNVLNQMLNRYTVFIHIFASQKIFKNANQFGFCHPTKTAFLFIKCHCDA